MLSAVFTNPQATTTAKPMTTAQILQTWWLNTIAENPKEWQKRFKRLKTFNWVKVLQDKNLTSVQKFEKIFAVSLKDVAVSGLGDIFSDIGNFFSQSNLNKLEEWIRQGQITFSNIGNAINVIKNQPSVQSQVQQQIAYQDLQTKFLTQGSAIWQTYSMPIAIAGGLLIVYLLAKKK